MRQLKLTKKTIVYVLAPSNVFTGGPELLHQIAVNIKKIFKVKTKMVYLPNNESNPVHKNFKNYKLEYSNYIEDKKNNILIIPEYYMFIKYAFKYKNITKILWWLSVDNYLGYKFRDDFNKYSRSLIKIPYNIINTFNKIVGYYYGIFTFHDYLKVIYSFGKIQQSRELGQINLHLAQSDYAMKFLKEKFKNLKFLSDFQRPIILKESKKKNKKKSDLICYSSKSNNFIEKLKNFTNFKMIKLSGFNDKQLINIYKKTKVYIDFGFHPGKDRMPREAALFNNCIITNRKGSANNHYDIPINTKYKITEKKSNLKKIKITIQKIFLNHKKELMNFKNYRKKIMNEKLKFDHDLKKIFIKSKT
tara:strand:- start:2064 stop:3146 length:1083 start_codon:yes stop_codon:yes gene_type:complete